MLTKHLGTHKAQHELPKWAARRAPKSNAIFSTARWHRLVRGEAPRPRRHASGPSPPEGETTGAIRITKQGRKFLRLDHADPVGWRNGIWKS